MAVSQRGRKSEEGVKGISHDRLQDKNVSRWSQWGRLKGRTGEEESRKIKKWSKIWLQYGCYFFCPNWCIPSAAAVAKLSQLLAWSERSHGLWPGPHPPPCTTHTHTHIYTHKLPHPSSYSRNTEWIKGKIIHSCKGLQKRRPLVPRLPYSPPHIIPWTPQTIINHAHCITVTLSFIYETPRKSGSHTTSGLLLLLPPAPGSDPLSLCVYVSEWLCVCRGQSQGQCR